jgi:carnitine O-acetyltransferase
MAHDSLKKLVSVRSNVASASPDAYIQLVLQLAYYRMYKKPTAVYESASTRFFLHGRTETGRSMSNESLAFIQSFDNDDILVT